MKLFKILFVAFCAFVFFSCQKELVGDPEAFVTTSAGTLQQNPAGTCMPASVQGVYRKDSLLNNTNYIDLRIDITATGSYVVQSDTVNGYSFYGFGTFSSTGVGSMRIFASGTPINEGVNTFRIRYDSSDCDVTVTVIGSTTVPPPPPPPLPPPNNPPPSNFAVFTLGTGTACTGVVLTGVYEVERDMLNANTAKINVNVVTPGPYTITTPSVNGVIFSKVGTFTTTGPQTVTLSGYGRPLESGTKLHTVTGPQGSCTFPVTYNGKFLLVGNTSDGCTNSVIAGSYVSGTPLNSSNKVTLQVNVLVPGPYTFTTPTVNGMTFSTSGTFTTAGQQPMVLQGTGTPQFQALSWFLLLNQGVSSCGFNINVLYGAPPAGGDFIKATIDGVPMEFLYNSTANLEWDWSRVDGIATVAASSNVSFGFSVGRYLMGDSIQTGTYTMAGSGYFTSPKPYQVSARFMNGAVWKPAAGPVYNNHPNIDPWTITITYLDAVRMIGTFSGTMRNESGNGTETKTVTNGSFNLRF